METTKPADFDSWPDNHVTIVTQRSDRRIMAQGKGSRRQFCGATPTDRDMTIADAKRDPSWIKCPTCRAEAERARSRMRGPSQAKMDRISAQMEADDQERGGDTGNW